MGSLPVSLETNESTVFRLQEHRARHQDSLLSTRREDHVRETSRYRLIEMLQATPPVLCFDSARGQIRTLGVVLREELPDRIVVGIGDRRVKVSSQFSGHEQQEYGGRGYGIFRGLTLGLRSS